MGRDVGAASAVAWLRNVGQSFSDWLRLNTSVVSSLLDSLLIITNATKPGSNWLLINIHAVKNLASITPPSTLLPKCSSKSMLTWVPVFAKKGTTVHEPELTQETPHPLNSQC